MWKWMGLFLRKNHLLRCSGSLAHLNWIGTLTLSLLLKLPPINLEAWFVLSPEVAQYLYKSIIQPCMEYCCRVWAGAPKCFLELLDKLQKQISRTVGPSLATSFEPLAYPPNVASIVLFCSYYFDRCLSELTQLVPLFFLEGGLLIILIDCMIFLLPFLDVTRMSMSGVSLPTQLDSGIICL